MALPFIAPFRGHARLALALGVLLCLFPAALAQNPPPTEQPRDSGQPPIATEGDAPNPDDPRLKEPLYGLVTAEPYAHWTRHVGTVEQAIALVTARDASGQTRQTTGLVIRCDGFVLAPLWIKEAFTKEKQAISVTVAEAENESLKESLPVVNRVYDSTIRCTYTVVKVNDHHIPCLPLLDGNSIAAGDTVRIVRAVADGPGKCKAVSVSGRVVRQTEAELKGRKDRWVLRAAEGEPALTADTAPSGSIVVDEVSGAAVGIVLDASAVGAAPGEPVFSSFLYFYDSCADVGVMPDRAAIKERQGLPQWLSPGELARLSSRRKTTGIVWVPGGAVQLSGTYADVFRRNYRTIIACTPGFFIAVNPVTNGEYRRWLATVPPPRRVPLGWDAPNDELANPRRDPSFPVLGVQPYDAQAYIAAQSQRLPTYVEWQRAAMSRNYQWAVQQYEAMYLAYSRINTGLEAYLRFRNEREESERKVRKRNDIGVNTVGTEEYTRTLNYLLTVIRGLLSATREALPTQPCDVNLRTDDVSIFGAANVLMNSPEMVLTPISQTPVLAPKFRPAPVDPYVSTVGRMDQRENIGRHQGDFYWSIGYLNGRYLIDIAQRLAMDPQTPPWFFVKYWTLTINAGLSPGSYSDGANVKSGAAIRNIGDDDVLVDLYASSHWDTGTAFGFRGAR